ncbi:hypothetical protein AGMMS49949_04120 [Alphaproteobacteria bacterium]|nr:hypothetical protein AGMMS49949_04120 [Alphaproteobacteria bacterium]GHS96989.1 hypothetical protein AGMMS50296_3570 [Alphaproteobacteria bacterium]
MSPTFVEDVINRGSQTEVITPSGVKRVVHSLGSAKVYTEQGGTIVVTVNSLRGGE